MLTHRECPRRGASRRCVNAARACVRAVRHCYVATISTPSGDRTTPAQLAGRAPNLWRYRELLPVADPAYEVTLGEGWTPLLEAPRWRRHGPARVAGEGEATAHRVVQGARRGSGGVPCGRAGGSSDRHAHQWQRRRGVGYLRRTGRNAGEHRDAEVGPGPPRRECLAAGAELYLVDGLIGDAADVVRTMDAESGGTVFNASTLREPYRIEGKKTMGLEIVEQLGWRAPDVIVYPTGGGVGLIGIDKGVSELRALRLAG